MLFGALLDRSILLQVFGFLHTGTDDVIFWNVAADMAKGIFREPFLYGQNYNPAVESILAVPLIWLGLPIPIAMPLVTSALALAPFFSFGFWYKRRGELGNACFFVAMPLLLPVEWGMVTMVSRGFVTGIALLALLPWLLNTSHLWRSSILAGSILYAAVLTNPNALLFALPFALWWAMQGRKFMVRSSFLMLGALPLVALHFFALRFYALRPDIMVHRIDDWRMTFHPGELIPEALLQLDLHFAWLAPVWWTKGSLILILLLLVIFRLVQLGRKAFALVLFTVFPVMLFSFAFPKVHDGFNSVFFPYDRMFLALPLLLTWAIAELRLRIPLTRWSVGTLVVCAGLFLVYKESGIHGVVQRELDHQELLPVREVRVADYQRTVETIARVANANEAKAIIAFGDNSKYTGMLLAYGGSATHQELVPTLFVAGDRRYWRRLEELHATHSTVLVLSAPELLGEALLGPVLAELQFAGEAVQLRLVSRNTLPTFELIERLKVGPAS